MCGVCVVCVVCMCVYECVCLFNLWEQNFRMDSFADFSFGKKQMIQNYFFEAGASSCLRASWSCPVALHVGELCPSLSSRLASASLSWATERQCRPCGSQGLLLWKPAAQRLCLG